jgi:hypothetical protein
MGWAGGRWANKSEMVAAYAALGLVIIGVVRVMVFALFGY